MDIDGDGLLGLVEKGGNALAADIIPRNNLARHQGDGNK